MDSASRYYCSKCYSMYDELNHKPRIIQKCLHSFCEQCLSKMIDSSRLICSEDQVVVERVRSVDDFPLNYELLRYIRQNKSPKVIVNVPTTQAVPNFHYDSHEDNSTPSQSSSHLMNTTFRFNGDERTINLGKNNQVCPIHRYKFEYYCQDHKLPLCLSCVQGKEHQNHSIIDNHELNKKIIGSKERIENIHSSLKDQHLYYENEQKSLLNDVHQILQNRQREVTLLIEQKFQDLVHKLRNLEDLAIRQVGILVLKMEDYVRETLSFSQKDICFQITEFHRRLDQISMEPQIQLTEQEDSIVKQGQSIMQKIQTFLNKEKHQISLTIAENIRVNFKDLNLENYCQIPTALQLSPSSSSPIKLLDQKPQPQPQPQPQTQSHPQSQPQSQPHSQQQTQPKSKTHSHLQSYISQQQSQHQSQHQSQNQSQNQSQQQSQPLSHQQLKSPSGKRLRQSIDASYLSYSKNSNSRHTQIIETGRITKTEGDNNKQSPHFVLIAPQTEKNKKSSSKQQNFFLSNPRGKSNDSRIIDGIKLQLMSNKDLDKLDMSNYDLYDADIVQICEWLLCSKSNIEIIKLAKNKITDQGFSNLLRCLQKRPNIHTLNLTSNLCSEKALIILEQYLKKGKLHIKNIYLTNCKINPGKYKDQQQELQRQGINLYL